MPAELAAARAALERLRLHLPAETADVIAQRLARWETLESAKQQPAVTLPQLVMRPGLPPRPLTTHYFTVVRSYE